MEEVDEVYEIHKIMKFCGSLNFSTIIIFSFQSLRLCCAATAVIMLAPSLRTIGLPACAVVSKPWWHKKCCCILRDPLRPLHLVLRQQCSARWGESASVSTTSDDGARLFKPDAIFVLAGGQQRDGTVPGWCCGSY